MAPISVSIMTGLTRAEPRLSPRVLFLLLTVLVMFISEVVARLSLPPATLGTQAQLFQRFRTVEQIYTFKLIFNTLLTLDHPWYFGCSQDS